MNDLTKELASLLNRACRENESNTPDYILAEYLMGVLTAYEVAVSKRDEWWGLKPWAKAAAASGLAPRAPETAPANIAATATPYICDICNTLHSAGEKPCPIPIDKPAKPSEPCATCGGQRGDRWSLVGLPCPDCGGSGVRP